MIPSSFQTNIFNAIENETYNILIAALAGSGKTTTIVKALELLPKGSKTLFLAFNKAIAEELQARVPSGVEARTLNSFGASILNKGIPGYKNLKMEKTEWKYKDIIGLKEYNKEAFAFFNATKAFVKRVISLFKAQAIFQPTAKDVDTIASEYNLDYPTVKPEQLDMVNDYILKTYKNCLKDTKLIDFDDQLALPIFYNLKFPKYDYVFVDESQDLNTVQILMLQRLMEA